MLNKIKYALMFLAGATSGFGVASIIFKSKYDKLNEKDRNELEEFYKRKIEKYESQKKEVLAEYEEIAKEYKEESEPPKEKKKTNRKTKKTIYPISEDEYAILDNYDTAHYHYFDDGVLTDEDDSPLTSLEIDNQIGTNLFNEFKDNSVIDAMFIRNDILKLDIELIKEHSKWGNSRYDE